MFRDWTIKLTTVFFETRIVIANKEDQEYTKSNFGDILVNTNDAQIVHGITFNDAMQMLRNTMMTSPV